MTSHPDLATLQDRLGVSFDDEGLLERALVHRSWAFENGGLIPNERLEFLGDAVLSLVVTDEVFHLEPQEQEGRLAKLRAAAVRTSSLAEIARLLDLGSFVLLGKGEAASGGAAKESILADTLEAVIGAYYLDKGFEPAYALVHDLFTDRLAMLVDTGAALDYKTSLQELSAARYGSLPVYEVTDVGPDHAKTFTATVAVDGQPRGRGEGSSKKQAEQRAARLAYQALSGEAAGPDGDAVPADAMAGRPRRMPVGTAGRGLAAASSDAARTPTG